MHNFTPLRSLFGGVIIGILGGLFTPGREGRGWRLEFLAGLGVGALLLLVVQPEVFGSAGRSLPVLALAGLLVGFGARLGGGCTSGHGVCGLSRISGRSLVATLVFMGTAAITVLVTG